jgi:hypothetical protein
VLGRPLVHRVLAVRERHVDLGADLKLLGAGLAHAVTDGVLEALALDVERADAVVVGDRRVADVRLDVDVDAHDRVAGRERLRVASAGVALDVLALLVGARRAEDEATDGGAGLAELGGGGVGPEQDVVGVGCGVGCGHFVSPR